MRKKIQEKAAEKGKILSESETDAESFKRIISDTDMLTDPRGLASISEASPKVGAELTSLLEGVRAKIEGNGEVDFSGNTVENGNVKGYDGNIDLNKDRISSIATFDLHPTHSITLGKKAFARLFNDIKINGITEPIKYIEYNGEKYVVDGHHRLMIAKKLGIKDIPAEEVELPYLGYSTAKDLLWFE